MATTLTSSITEVDVPRLKKDLESLGDIRVVSIAPPQGVFPTTVILTKSDKVSNLSGPQIAAAQAVIDAHVNFFDASAQEVSTDKVTVGTIEAGVISFINNGEVWRIDATKNLVPVGTRNIGAPGNPVSVLYVSTIVGAGGGGGGGNTPIYSEVPVGTIDGANALFTTSNNFISGSTRVFLNGMRLLPGLAHGYRETSVNQITLTSAPLNGDEIVLDYDLSV